MGARQRAGLRSRRTVGGPAVHFGFNAWGGKFDGWQRDERAGRVLAERFGDPVYEAPLVLEGGSVIIDAAGRLVTTEQCLLHPNRNPGLSKADIQTALGDYLGAARWSGWTRDYPRTGTPTATSI